MFYKKVVAVILVMVFTLLPSGYAMAETETISPPEKVKAVSDKATNDVEVTWEQTEGAVKYHVFRSKTKEIPNRAYKTVTKNILKDKNLKGRAKYSYWIVAENAEGELSEHSAPATVEVAQYLTGGIRTVSWYATTRKNIVLGGKKIKKGSKVIPTKHTKYIMFRGPKKAYIVYKNAEGKKIASGWVKWSAIKNVRGVVSYDSKNKKMVDWTKERKEAYVKKYSSKTKYLIWTSFYTQRVNIFKGGKNHWKLYKTFRCTTGKFEKQTPKGKKMVIRKHKPRRTRYNGRIKLRYYYKYLSFMNKWDAFHSVAWRLPDNKLIKNIVKNGQPNTTGCVRLTVKNAKYIYDKIPIGTRLIMY